MSARLAYVPLKMMDYRFCLDLASDPAVRAVSLDRRPPTRWGHLRWMLRWIFGRGRVACIVMAQNEDPAAYPYWKRVGLVRAATLPGGGAEVSIALTAAARGRGWGTQALRELSPMLKKKLGGRRLWARIRRSNVASVRAFLSAGYVERPPAYWPEGWNNWDEITAMLWIGR